MLRHCFHHVLLFILINCIHSHSEKVTSCTLVFTWVKTSVHNK